MLKASALYLVIVIALVIGLICSSLVAVAYFYRAEYQKKFRQDRLNHNLLSGINLLLAASDAAYKEPQRIALFGSGGDSIIVQKKDWGIFDIATVRTFAQRDTIYKAFFIAGAVYSAKWAALYIADDDRPVSVSGKTRIEGTAYLPKAGIQTAYVDNKAYEGDKRLVIGGKKASDKTLPVLDAGRLGLLDSYFQQKGDSRNTGDSMSISYLKPTKTLDFKKQAYTLSGTQLKGNLVLRSDTALAIDSSAKLDNVLVFAPAIIVKEGFRGTCQLFATDSISVAKNCLFSYPSCLGIIRSNTGKFSPQAKITVGEASVIEGTVFTWEKTPGALKPVIRLSKKDTISGQVYSQDGLSLKDGCVIYGSLYTKYFLYQNSFTLYENYLINAELSSRELSPYYLGSGMLPAISKKKKILQWLEGN